jgi:2-keto-3-deoxy-L-rhamnonate aldolase RhmA
MSLGILGQLRHPSFEEALLRVVEAAKKHNIIPGIATLPVSGEGCLPELSRLLEMGFRMISLSYDVGFLVEAASNLLNAAKRLTLNQESLD